MPLPPLAVAVTGISLPLHTLVGGVAVTLTVGNAFTVTVLVVAVAPHPLLSTALSVYVPVAVGVAVMLIGFELEL